MTGDEMKRNALHAIIRHTTRLSWEEKLGKTQYSLTRYERVIRSTIPLRTGYLLLASFDVTTDNIDKLIVSRVMPAVENYHP